MDLKSEEDWEANYFYPLSEQLVVGSVGTATSTGGHAQKRRVKLVNVVAPGNYCHGIMMHSCM